MKYFKKEANKSMDMIVLDGIGKTGYDSFSEYKEDMEDFTFSSIFN